MLLGRISYSEEEERPAFPMIAKKEDCPAPDWESKGEVDVEVEFYLYFVRMVGNRKV